MTPDSAAARAREFFSADMPNYAVIEFDTIRVPGALTRQTVVTDDVETVRTTFKAARCDLEGLVQDQDVLVFTPRDAVALRYVVAEFDEDNQFKTVVLAKT